MRRKAKLVSDNVMGHRVYKTSLGSTIRVRTICEMKREVCNCRPWDLPREIMVGFHSVTVSVPRVTVSVPR